MNVKINQNHYLLTQIEKYLWEGNPILLIKVIMGKALIKKKQAILKFEYKFKKNSCNEKINSSEISLVVVEKPASIKNDDLIVFTVVDQNKTGDKSEKNREAFAKNPVLSMSKIKATQDFFLNFLRLELVKN